ncbi:MAG: O-antigen ligase family protein [Candidatus Krumholzibacteria bacterium]|jgi:O-antigen ligase|nr:O-antigen ligase family protein [Candidatus Krumholzibacteria bacterium]
MTIVPVLLSWGTLLLILANEYWIPGKQLPSLLRPWNLGRTLFLWFILAGPASMVLGSTSPSNFGFWVLLILTMILSWIVGAMNAGNPAGLLRHVAWIWLAYLAWYFTLGAQYLDSHPYERNGLFAVGIGAGLAASWGFRGFWSRASLLSAGMFLTFLTEQRTGLIASFLCVLWVLCWIALSRLRAWRGMAIPFLVPLLILLALLWQPIWSMINDFLLLDDPVRGVGTGFTGRARIWALALVHFLQSPWFGHGPLSNDYILYDVIMGQRTAHNGILALLVDYGVFGALPALLLFLLALKRGVTAFLASGEVAWLGWTSVIVFILVYSLGEKYWFHIGNQTNLLGLVALGLIFEGARFAGKQEGRHEQD